MPEPSEQPQEPVFDDPVGEAVESGDEAAECHKKFQEHQRSEASIEAGTQALALLDVVQKGIQLHEGSGPQRDERLDRLKDSLKEQLSNDNGLALLKWLRPKLKGLNGWYNVYYQEKAENLAGLLSYCRQYKKDLQRDLRVRKDIQDNHLTRRTLLFFYCDQGPQQDFKKALPSCKQLAESGCSQSQDYLGWMYENARGVEKDEEEALKWYRKAAEQGYAPAQNNLARMYRDGLGVEQDDEEAVKWYQPAAEQGYAPAQNNLARMYRDGLGVKQDDKESAKWYRKAADQGEAYGQNNLGHMYFHGKGLRKNRSLGIKYYLKAAEQGFAHAQVELHRIYSEGDGVPPDSRQAARWFRRAEKQNDPETNSSLAWRLAENGRRLDKALELIEAALKADPKHANHHDTYGWVLFKQGELKPALRETQKAIRLQGTPPNYYHPRNLGHIQTALGNYKQAANAFIKALKLEGSNDEKASFHKALEKAGATKEAARLKNLQAKNKINA